MRKTAIAAAACALAASSAYAGASQRVPQYDAFFAPESESLVRAKSTAAKTRTGTLAKRLTAKVKGSDVGPGGVRANFDAKLGGNTVLWVRGGKEIASKAAAAPLKRSAQAEAIARAAIKANASALVVGRAGINNAKLSEVHDNGKGLVIARFQQQVGELEVFNRQMAVLMDRQLVPKTITGYFAPDAQVIKAQKSPGRFP